MKIRFRTKKLERICVDRRLSVRLYGEESADGLTLSLRVLESYAFDELLKNRLRDFHALLGNRAGQYAMRISKKSRLIIVVIDKENDTSRIEEIVDYH